MRKAPASSDGGFYVRAEYLRGKASIYLNWSEMYPVDRHRIISSVPGLPGIWELYWLENRRTPHLLKAGKAWYGGLRSELRSAADDTLPENRKIQEKLRSGSCYYRYVICEDRNLMGGAFALLLRLRGIGDGSGPEGDYRIYEPEDMRIRYRPVLPGEGEEVRTFGNEVPNMFDVVETLKRLSGDD